MKVGISIVGVTRGKVAPRGQNRGASRRCGDGAILEKFGDGSEIRPTQTANYDPSKTNQNVTTFKDENIHNGKELLDNLHERLDNFTYAVTYKTGRRAGQTIQTHVKESCVYGYLWCMFPTGKDFDKLPRNAQIKFWIDGQEVLAEIDPILFGENVEATSEHRDEGALHFEGFSNTIKGNKWTRENFPALPLVKKINRDFPRLMRERGWDIEDNDIYDIDRGKEDEEYHQAHVEKKRHQGLSANDYGLVKERRKAEAALDDVKAVAHVAIQDSIHEERKAKESAKQAKERADDLQQQLDTANANNADLQRQLAQLQQEQTDTDSNLQKQLNTATATNAQLQQQLTKLQKEHDEALAQIERINDIVENRQSTKPVTDLDLKIEAVLNDRAAQADRITSLQTDLDNALTAKTTAEENARQLTADKGTMAKTLARANQTIKTKDTEVKRLKSDLNNFNVTASKTAENALKLIPTLDPTNLDRAYGIAYWYNYAQRDYEKQAKAFIADPANREILREAYVTLDDYIEQVSEVIVDSGVGELSTAHLAEYNLICSFRAMYDRKAHTEWNKAEVLGVKNYRLAKIVRDELADRNIDPIELKDIKAHDKVKVAGAVEELTQIATKGDDVIQELDEVLTSGPDPEPDTYEQEDEYYTDYYDEPEDEEPDDPDHAAALAAFYEAAAPVIGRSSEADIDRSYDR